ncbi:MAG: RuBisCO accumulation factor 1, partial [Dolichospermum sp.]
MTEIQPNSQNLEDTATELLVKLRQKQGSWVEWGQAIAYLQKNGYNPQTIFEATGFEPIQQNQVIVGSQVYASMEKCGASAETLAYYKQKSSDVLYELRGLNQEDRASTADLTFEYKLDADVVRDIAKAVKDFSWFPNLPEGFSKHPGDAVAYQSWKFAKQKSDLSERSRLIAKGLRFAHSESARKQLEQLLMDFSVAPKVAPPILPFYRLESDEDLPRILPVIGELPLTPEDLKAVPLITEIQPFRMVKFAGEQAWVSLPGWKVLLNAEDPV